MSFPAPTDIPAVLPELLLAVSSAMLLLVEAFAPKLRRYAAEITAVAFALAAWLRFSGELPGPVFSGMLAVDAVGQFVDLYILGAAFLVTVMSSTWLRKTNRDSAEFYCLLILSAVGAMVMAKSTHLLMIFLGLELLSMPLYVLNAYDKKTEASIESGLKYFIVGAFASGFMVYGMALIYGSAQTMSVVELVTKMGSVQGSDIALLSLGLAMVLGGLGFKLALFPFHGWAPDVYQGAPTPVTAFLSVVPKGAALIVAVRLIDAIDPASLGGRWYLAIGTLAVGSMALGNIVAIVQRDLKRMLAYSGIAHMGYAAVALTAGSYDGAMAVLVYLAAYTVMNIGAFACVNALTETPGQRRTLSDIEGQGWERPVIGAVFAVCMFSLAGVPPFVGFIGKFLVFKAAVDAGFISLAVFGVLASMVSAYFYLRVVYSLYMRPLPKRKPIYEPTWSLKAVAIVTGVLCLLLGVMPQGLLEAAKTAAISLIGG